MKTQRQWTTRKGQVLELDLTPEENELFEQAQRLFKEKAKMDEIARLYMAPTSVLYKGRTGEEVVRLPLYQAIKDMGTRRGLEDGLLSDRPGSQPDLDSFEARHVN